MDAEALYRELGQLVATVPQGLADDAVPISPEMHRWFGRASALIRVAAVSSGDKMDMINFTTAVDHLDNVFRQSNAHQIVAILHRALARAELNAPAAAQGAFISVGQDYDVYQVISKVLIEAKNDAFIVDAYMGAKVFDFVPLVAEGIGVRLLADSKHAKPEILKPALDRWTKQYVAKRPLEIRLTPPRLLHDRLIAIDGAQLWLLSQSLEHFAARASATVVRVDDTEIAEQKIYAHEQLWADAKPI